MGRVSLCFFLLCSLFESMLTSIPTLPALSPSPATPAIVRRVHSRKTAFAIPLLNLKTHNASPAVNATVMSIPHDLTPTTQTIAATVESVNNNFPLALALSSLAGASTGLGGLLAVLQRDLSVRRLGIWQGAAAGFMLSVSIFDLGPTILDDIDLFPAAVFFCVGGMIFVLLKQYIPEPDMDVLALAKNNSDLSTSRDVLWSGLLTAAGISLHNFPEGIAVCVASLRGIEFGLPLAIAIGLHNIPEGMAVSLPLYFATRDKGYAVRMAFLSGMAEPAGVVFVLGLIHLSGQLSKSSIAGAMSMVAGIMVVLSFIELIPQAVKHAGRQQAALSTGAGLVAMTLLMRILDWFGLGV